MILITSLGKLSICMEKFVEYIGVNINHNVTYATTPSKCQKICQTIDDCVAFTWDEAGFGSFRCDLMSEVISRRPTLNPSPFLISGPKYCLGEPQEIMYNSK